MFHWKRIFKRILDIQTTLGMGWTVYNHRNIKVTYNWNIKRMWRSVEARHNNEIRYEPFLTISSRNEYYHLILLNHRAWQEKVYVENSFRFLHSIVLSLNGVYCCYFVEIFHLTHKSYKNIKVLYYNNTPSIQRLSVWGIRIMKFLRL